MLFWAFALWIFMRVFVFQASKVPTASMHNSLLEGDYIYVNKLAYGARLPMTPLSLHLGSEHYFLDWIQVPYCRLPGYSHVKRNDIVVFNLPSDNDQLPVDEKKDYVKRCIGLPGDTISIRAGLVSINGLPVAEAPTVVKWYTLSNKDLFITQQQADSFKTKGIALTKRSMPASSYTPGFFPNNPQFKWNPDSLGPFYIPKKGECMVLGKETFLLYQRLLETYEHNTVSIRNDSVFVNDAYTKAYTFKMDYYFMMGDNRYNSIDSRYWGLVPESYISGKASGVMIHAAK